MIDDAISWLKLLQADPRFDEIIVIGHSEGSLIGMAAAQMATADPLANTVAEQVRGSTPGTAMVTVLVRAWVWEMLTVTA